MKLVMTFFGDTKVESNIGQCSSYLKVLCHSVAVASKLRTSMEIMRIFSAPSRLNSYGSHWSNMYRFNKSIIAVFHIDVKKQSISIYKLQYWYFIFLVWNLLLSIWRNHLSMRIIYECLLTPNIFQSKITEVYSRPPHTSMMKRFANYSWKVLQLRAFQKSWVGLWVNFTYPSFLSFISTYSNYMLQNKTLHRGSWHHWYGTEQTIWSHFSNLKSFQYTKTIYHLNCTKRIYFHQFVHRPSRCF